MGAVVVAAKPPSPVVPIGIDIVDGVEVEKYLGSYGGALAGRLVIKLSPGVLDRQLGEVMVTGGGYQYAQLAGSQVRFPDASFVRAERLPGRIPKQGWLDIPPDLVVEVVSPNDTSDGVNTDVREWLDGGAQSVLVVYPGIQAVHVYNAGANAATLGPDDTLACEGIVPGFSCRAGDLFGAAQAT
jgi:Uma2 family endonuclease